MVPCLMLLVALCTAGLCTAPLVFVALFPTSATLLLRLALVHTVAIAPTVKALCDL